MARSDDEPARRMSRADEVRDALVERITSGELRPGDRVPAERALAAELAVSRNVVREALGGLVAVGLVETKPGAGVFVADQTMASVLKVIDPAVALLPSSLRTLLQVREVLEPGIAALAAQLAGADDLDALHQLVASSAMHLDDPPAYVDLDGEIHDAIVRMTRNSVLIWISDLIRRAARAARELTVADADLRRGALSDHQAIFEAIAARDPERAAEAMRSHLVFVQAQLLPFTSDLAAQTPARVG
jgi:GntR family transcriptional regulator, transcriptional repressor for pyruvate dehydrogenase complex